LQLIILSGAWLAGIYIGYRVELPLLSLLLGLLPLPLLFFPRLNRSKIIIAALGILLITGGAQYSYAAIYHVDESRIRFYNDTGPVEIKGTVAVAPDIRDKSARLILDAEAVYQDGRWREARGKVLVFAPRYPEYTYGDILNINGELETPPALDDFDYRGYLEHQGIYSTVYFPRIEVQETGRGFKPLEWIYDLRAGMARSLAAALPEPEASLAQGILLGLRGNIPAGLNDEFARSGTSHLLAISGYNLSVMVGLLLAAGIWILGRKRYLYVWLAFGALWFYTIITGLNPPVVRGAVMASVFLAAEALGRQRSSATALILAAAVMAGVQPYILGDASFQLSFLAMAGLIFVYPVFSSWSKGLITRLLGDKGVFDSLCGMVAEMFSVTFAAIITVWPLIAYYFNLFSITGPLATFLLTLVQPVIILLGMLAALAGLVLPGAGWVLGWLLWPFLKYMVLVVGWLGSSTSTFVQVGWITPGFLIAYYLALAAAVWLYGKRQRLRSLMAGTAGLMKTGVNITYGLAGGSKWIVAPLFLLALLTTFTAAAMPESKVKVSFLDVGEGDAILVQKGSSQVLIDGGPSPQAVMLSLSRQMPFWDRSIDAVILTHPHQDHLAGLMEVLKRYRVGMVVYPPLDYDSPTYDEFKSLIQEKGIKSVKARAGLQLTMGGGTQITLLSPPETLLTGTESDIDNNSVVLSVQDNDIEFLLTGDIMKDAERELLRHRATVACTVIKAAHHGSDTSSALEFLAVADPQIAVISAGEGNKFGHPDDSTVERLKGAVGEANVYRTDEQGTITFTTDGERLWVKTEK
jgi:competence protein ComEC